MRIIGNFFDPAEESAYTSKVRAQTEDGRAAPVSGAEMGLDAKEKAEGAKKDAFALPGDRVEISREARELLRVSAAENPKEEEEGDNDLKDFFEDMEKLKGMFDGLASSPAGKADKAAESGNDNEVAERLRKMIREAQKKLRQAEEELSRLMAEASDEGDPVAKQALQVKLRAAQQKAASANAEVQALNDQLQQALQTQGGGWRPGGKRIEVSAGGTVSV